MNCRHVYLLSILTALASTSSWCASYDQLITRAIAQGDVKKAKQLAADAKRLEVRIPDSSAQLAQLKESELFTDNNAHLAASIQQRKNSVTRNDTAKVQQFATTAMVTVKLDELPLEILELVAEFLDLKSCGQMAQTSKEINQRITKALFNKFIKHCGLRFKYNSCADNDAQCALITAIINNKLWAINAAIQFGADVNFEKNFDQLTTLTLAIFIYCHEDYERTPKITKLINARAHVNATNSDGTTALTYAFANGYEKTADQLLNAGADIKTAFYEIRPGTPKKYHYDHLELQKKIVNKWIQEGYVAEWHSPVIQKRNCNIL